jgi:hypothetical protein
MVGLDTVPPVIADRVRQSVRARVDLAWEASAANRPAGRRLPHLRRAVVLVQRAELGRLQAMGQPVSRPAAGSSANWISRTPATAMKPSLEVDAFATHGCHVVDLIIRKLLTHPGFGACTDSNPHSGQAT